jgi:hypothetical protein
MSFTILCTPKCPICIRNYSNKVIPTVLYPCGHGLCKTCIQKYRTVQHDEGNEEIPCPICREPIVKDFNNYDLRAITENVYNDELSYWSKRLIEQVDLEGSELYIHPQVEQFSKAICTRIAYKTDMNNMDEKEEEFWTSEEVIVFKTFKRSFLQTLKKHDISADVGLKWLRVLVLPKNYNKIMLTEVLAFYDIKAFLEPLEADWLIDLFQ